MSNERNPLSPKNNIELKCVFAREVSAIMVTFSAPVNTVYRNIVFRGRGGYYYTSNRIRSASVQGLLAEIVYYAYYY